jgi:hypothetical protein
MRRGPGYLSALEWTINSAQTLIAPEIPGRPEFAVNSIAGVGKPERAERSVAALGTHTRSIAHLDQQEFRVIRRVLTTNMLGEFFRAQDAALGRFLHGCKPRSCIRQPTALSAAEGRSWVASRRLVDSVRRPQNVTVDGEIFYSWRRARMGSMRMARRVGM